jgi:predicted transcriptional regulator
MTTIRISKELQDVLKSRKMVSRDTYEEVMGEVLEPEMELSEETLKNIEQSRKEIKKGLFYTHEEIKKERGL